MQTFCHLIDGELVAGRHDFEVVNPSIGAPFARCPDATREEVDAAMAAAALRARADVPAPRRRTRGARAAGEARGRPINDRPQFERVQELVDDARRAGGTVEVGGAPLSRPGYFYPPTLVTGVGGASGSSTRSSSGPRCPSSHTPTSKMRSRRPTAHTTASAARCGRPTCAAARTSPSGSSPAPRGSTSTSTRGPSRRSAE
ncbi:MAG: aldehyde dehydrogenase family protein [Deltaproteobacteria bacterium]|nr:MAG: aldehyde dehydrogenase family protein [Deltaproteobacteria bacterium]